ncbi:MAG: YHS domain-containing (seleno)protein [Kiloniellales bacterium]
MPWPAAAKDPVNAPYGRAIEGYDAVAYFREGRARVGSARYPYFWNGAVWLFSTPANRDAFAAEPRRFAPRYGGYSAYGISQGQMYPIDPSAFLIIDGRLYLHANHYVKRLFAQDPEARIADADAHWRRILDNWSE